MRYGICSQPLASMYAEGSHRSELVNQILFGDTYEVLKLDDEDFPSWAYVRLSHDGYEGWISVAEWTELHPFDYKLMVGEPHPIVGLSLHTMCLKMGKEEAVKLAPGSTLPLLFEDTVTIINQKYLFLGESSMPEPKDFFNKLEETAMYYLNAPYLWGGRSVFGVDCSGFIQLVFKHLGISVPRDARQQSKLGEEIVWSERRAGDLAFFSDLEGKITHVGLMLSHSRIIHASGRVRADELDNFGIRCIPEGGYSHTLHTIRRLVPPAH